MILLIDNYDSFVYNLARYFARLGHSTHVARNDAIDVAAIRELRPRAIVLSPGPCTPSEAGCSLDVVRQLTGEIPMLGVCLGHQAIGAAFGGQVLRAEPMHGRSSLITHDAHGIFEGLPSPLSVGRYHSLAVSEAGLPPDLKVTARSEDGVVMGLAHRRHATIGVQFHPESILTEGGYELLANFLRIAGLDVAGMPSMAEESPRPSAEGRTLPAVPVTF
ncbi:MAG TPA: aminodeoxychorismate/anthranilate synthase component II [Pirellulaceae bacterium]|nr:aminodeoxychorismate/anthranilate synthase component II [Pirellulaceae bacterium]